MTGAGDATGVERLDEKECLLLLKRTAVGRLAVRAGEGVDVFPVNYCLDEERIVLRSTHGQKLLDLTIHPQVAFEIDGQDGWKLWSVVVKGAARTPELASELQHLHELGLASFSPLAKTVYVVIEPREITGRRFTKRLEQDPTWA